MGIGDHLMAVGDAWRARRADPQGRLVALGDGRRLYPAKPMLTAGLDFLATREDLQRGRPVNWVVNYAMHRPYIDLAAMRAEAVEIQLDRWRRLGGGRERWLWPWIEALWRSRDIDQLVAQTGRYRFQYHYRVSPAPVRLTPAEQAFAKALLREGPFIVIEPYIKKDAPPSKQWPVERFRAVARALAARHRVLQLSGPDQPALDPRIPRLMTPSFREALATLGAAQLHIGPEGGLHHGAAAMGTPAVVVFGGFTAPEILGYEGHVNLTGDAGEACGTRFGMCPHCRAALERITVDEVLHHARRLLDALPPPQRPETVTTDTSGATL